MSTKSILTIEKFHTDCPHFADKPFELMAYPSHLGNSVKAELEGRLYSIGTYEGYDAVVQNLGTAESTCETFVHDPVTFVVAFEE